MAKDWAGTAFEQAVRDGIAADGLAQGTWPLIKAALDGLDAAGLLLTPDQLDEIASRIEANMRFASIEQRPALKAAAAIVRQAAQR